MLPNPDPVLDDDVLSALDAMSSGELLMVAAGDYPRERCGRLIFEFPAVSTAEAVTQLLVGFPLDREGAPLAYCDEPWFDDGLPDAAFAVSSAAADAERRRVSMTRLPAERFHALAASAPVTVLVDRLGSSAAFLLRRA